MTQNLNHYEKILSRSHSNYLAQISIDMTDANNQMNEVLSRMTALGTVLMCVSTPLYGPDRSRLTLALSPRSLFRQSDEPGYRSVGHERLGSRPGPGGQPDLGASFRHLLVCIRHPPLTTIALLLYSSSASSAA
jgi:hypothetical protein